MRRPVPTGQAVRSVRRSNTAMTSAISMNTIAQVNANDVAA
jgi:hypothetical protein